MRRVSSRLHAATLGCEAVFAASPWPARARERHRSLVAQHRQCRGPRGAAAGARRTRPPRPRASRIFARWPAERDRPPSSATSSSASISSMRSRAARQRRCRDAPAWFCSLPMCACISPAWTCINRYWRCVTRSCAASSCAIALRPVADRADSRPTARPRRRRAASTPRAPRVAAFDAGYEELRQRERRRLDGAFAPDGSGTGRGSASASAIAVPCAAARAAAARDTARDSAPDPSQWPRDSGAHRRTGRAGRDRRRRAAAPSFQTAGGAFHGTVAERGCPLQAARETRPAPTRRSGNPGGQRHRQRVRVRLGHLRREPDHVGLLRREQRPASSRRRTGREIVSGAPATAAPARWSSRDAKRERQ